MMKFDSRILVSKQKVILFFQTGCTNKRIGLLMIITCCCEGDHCNGGSVFTVHDTKASMPLDGLLSAPGNDVKIKKSFRKVATPSTTSLNWRPKAPSVPIVHASARVFKCMDKGLEKSAIKGNVRMRSLTQYKYKNLQDECKNGEQFCYKGLEIWKSSRTHTKGCGDANDCPRVSDFNRYLRNSSF